MRTSASRYLSILVVFHGLLVDILVHAHGHLSFLHLLYFQGHHHLAFLVDALDGDDRSVGNDVALQVGKLEGLVNLLRPGRGGQGKQRCKKRKNFLHKQYFLVHY